MSLVVIAASTVLFFSVLFGLATMMERSAAKTSTGHSGAVIYGLSLAIYCTSWTFYGSVGLAAGSGLAFAAVYLGPIGLFLLGRPLLTRVVTLAQRQHCTSIADFLSARYGRSRLLAGLVTVIAVFGIMPYISLQLKAVQTTFDILVHYPALAAPAASAANPLWADPSLYVAVILGAFCWLFGTQHIDATEQHRGLVAMVALESVLKLLAFLAAGSFAVWGLTGGLGTLFAQAAEDPRTAALLGVTNHLGSPNWWSIIVASAAAMICLPRQFQVLVVENTDPRHLRTASWLFPLYLVLINLFVLPIALVGLTTLGDAGVKPDSFVLALPISGAQPALALLVFLGGLSAATAMVLMETIALSTMISNDLVMPLLLRRLMTADAYAVERAVKAIRRAAVVVVLALAYVYFRVVGDSYALANIGLTSFAAAAQFAPAMVGGLIWRRASKGGAVAGLAVGFLVWAHTGLQPSLARSGWLPPGWEDVGLFGVLELAPHALFGPSELSHFTHSLLWSLLANIASFVLISRLRPPTGAEFRQTLAFLSGRANGFAEPSKAKTTVATLMSVVGRFAGWSRTERAFADYAATRRTRLVPRGPAEADLLIHAETLLAGAIGPASARMVLESLQNGRDQGGDLLTSSLDNSRGILVDALDELGQGVLVLDPELRLSACNRKFQELFDLPDALVGFGTPVQNIIRHNARRGEYGPCDVEAMVAQRMELVCSRQPHRLERERPDGTVLEIIGTPLPNGGIVTTYLDATRRSRAEQALRFAFDVLEQRVAERTRELSQEVQERVRTEAALRASKNRLEGITDSLFEGVLVTDRDGAVVFANTSARRLLLADRPMEGQSVDSLFRLSRDGQCLSFADGPFAAVVRFGGVAQDEDAVFVTAPGRSLNVAYACSVLEEDASVYAIISFKSIEALKTAQREVAQASRLAAVGQLAAGIAHEINTPAQYVGNNLGFLATSFSQTLPVIEVARELAGAAEAIDALAPLCRRLNDAAAAADLDYLLDEIPEAVRQSQEGIVQISRIVLSMKEFSHPGSKSKTLTNLNHAIETTLTVCRNEWKHVATVDLDLDPALPAVECFAAEINQVFLNLIINAAHAIEGSGKAMPGNIRISTRGVDGGVEISVADSGTGVPMAIRDRIFDPFFTTKEIGKGTGQGLAISHDVIVHKHHGRIEVSGEPGCGAVFTAWLPVGDGATRRAVEHHDAERPDT